MDKFSQILSILPAEGGSAPVPRKITVGRYLILIDEDSSDISGEDTLLIVHEDEVEQVTNQWSEGDGKEVEQDDPSSHYEVEMIDGTTYYTNSLRVLVVEAPLPPKEPQGL